MEKALQTLVSLKGGPVYSLHTFPQVFKEADRSTSLEQPPDPGRTIIGEDFTMRFIKLYCSKSFSQTL